MVDIIPAILSPTREDYHKRFKAVEPFADWIQIDVVDGKFAPNKTVGPDVVTSFRTSKKLEIQLMVNFIEDWIDPFVKTKAARIIVPVETARDPIGLVNHLRHHNIQVGFSLNPDTGTEKAQHLVDKVDSILLLSVHPGFQGQHFVHGVFKKIKELREMRSDLYIEIDGGIQPGIARKCAEAGASALCVGSFILKNDRIKGATYSEKVRNALELIKKDVDF